ERLLAHQVDVTRTSGAHEVRVLLHEERREPLAIEAVGALTCAPGLESASTQLREAPEQLLDAQREVEHIDLVMLDDVARADVARACQQWMQPDVAADVPPRSSELTPELGESSVLTRSDKSREAVGCNNVNELAERAFGQRS